MPDGEYQDFCYYIPNKCVKDNAEKGTVRLSLHNDYIVRLTNNKGEEKVTIKLNAKEFVETVKGKDESAYGAEYKKPSEEQKVAFAERENTLRDCVPDEMKARALLAEIQADGLSESKRAIIIFSRQKSG